MQKLQGIAVSPGVAIGEALVMDHEGFPHPPPVRRARCRRGRVGPAATRPSPRPARRSPAIATRSPKSWATSTPRSSRPICKCSTTPGSQSELEEMIRQRHYSPEYAVSRTLRRYAQVFQKLESRHLAERANDIFDIEKRLLRHLLGRRREGISHLTSPVLVLAHNLTPSEAANLDSRFVRGFVTEIGGPGSHTAIVAEALDIPAVVGTGPFLTEVSGGDQVIIDGDEGLVILQPDEETLARYRHEAEEIRIAGRAVGNPPRPARRNAPTACGSA